MNPYIDKVVIPTDFDWNSMSEMNRSPNSPRAYHTHGFRDYDEGDTVLTL